MKLSWALGYAQQKNAGAGVQTYAVIQGTVQRHNKDGSVIVKLDGGSVATITPTTDDILTEDVRVWVAETSVGYLVLGTVK